MRLFWKKKYPDLSDEELYAELNREHENNMGIVGIPLWLNSRLYSQIQNSKDADTAKKY